MNLLKILPRESNGANTSGKYDFQKDISICLLLEYHSSGKEYLFLFDFHDDLVILDSETTPILYNFLQIKGRQKGEWTLTSLLKQAKTKTGVSNSILGKLYLHLQNFKIEASELTFISNMEMNIPYGTADNCKNHDRACLKGLPNVSIEKIINSLKNELTLDEIDERFKDITFLNVSNLSIKDSSTHTKGKLSDFLSTHFENKKFNATAIYNNLFEEVKRKTKYDKSITTLEELSSKKGIGRTFFNELLTLIGAVKDYDKNWGMVQSSLQQANFKTGEIKHYRDLWKRLEVDRMNPLNTLLKECISDIKQILLDNSSSFRDKGLQEILSLVKNVPIKNTERFETEYIDVIILSEFYE